MKTRGKVLRGLSSCALLLLGIAFLEGCRCADTTPPESSKDPNEAAAASTEPAFAEERARRVVSVPSSPSQDEAPARAPAPSPRQERREPTDLELERAVGELGANDSQRRWEALEILEERGDAAAAEALGNYVQGAREEHHAYDALDSLSAIASPAATAAIAEVLAGGVSSQTKIYALESLMDIETPGAAAAARQAFADPDPEVRAEAIEAMLWFDDRGAVEDLRDALSRESDPDVRDLLVDVLDFYENTTPDEDDDDDDYGEKP